MLLYLPMVVLYKIAHAVGCFGAWCYHAASLCSESGGLFRLFPLLQSTLPWEKAVQYLFLHGKCEWNKEHHKRSILLPYLLNQPSKFVWKIDQWLCNNVYISSSIFNRDILRQYQSNSSWVIFSRGTYSSTTLLFCILQRTLVWLISFSKK